MKIDKNSKIDFEIKEEVNTDLMNQRLAKEKEKGFLGGGEQCFRQDYLWYRLNIGYTNPLNFGEVHAELELIKKQVREGAKNKIISHFKERHQIFYGIGVGDTEIEFVDWAIKLGDKNISVTGIDVNKNFLENFIIALKNRCIEPDKPTINFFPRNSLFEQIKKDELKIQEKKNAHICLGGTIGNFKDQEKLFEMFSKLMDSGDSLILSFQLKTNIDWIIKKYKENPLFPDFILNYLPKEKRIGINWDLNRETGVITAIHENIEVFRTTKYDKEKLKVLIEKKGFKFCCEDVDKYDNCCLQVFERI